MLVLVVDAESSLDQGSEAKGNQEEQERKDNEKEVKEIIVEPKVNGKTCYFSLIAEFCT